MPGSAGCGPASWPRLEKVPAILADWTDSESAALGLLENIQRSQLDPFDTARGIRDVIRLWGCTQAEAARRLGLSQPALANKLRLLSLTAAQQQLCTSPPPHRAPRPRRAPPAGRPPHRRAGKDRPGFGLSVRETDKLVEAMLTAAPGTPSPCRKTTPMVRDVRLFVNTLQHAVDLMTQKGIPATTTCGRRDGCLEYVVRIPVESADTSQPLPQASLDNAPAVPAPRPEPPAGPVDDPMADTLPDDSGQGIDSRLPDEDPRQMLGSAAHTPVMPPPASMPPAIETIARADSACAAPAAIPVVRVVSARPEPPEPDGATVASLPRQG